MRAASEVEKLKAQGNERFRLRDYAGALEQYNIALGGANGSGNGLQMGLMLPLLNNRAACYLEIADAMEGLGEARMENYHRAACDADEASKVARLMGGSAKALFRLGRATLGKETLQSQLVDVRLQRKQVSAEVALRLRKDIAKTLEVGCMNLRSALKMQPGDAMVMRTLEEAERLQQALALNGAPPSAQMILPVPSPETFDPSVVFTSGASWMENRVSLEVPVPNQECTGQVRMPMYLTKQENDNNKGELAIWMHYSAHLGKSELRTRGEAAYGENAKYDVFDGNAYGNLSTPAQADDHIQSPDEFIMDFAFARHGQSLDDGIPAALVAAGVIERVRVAGHTGFGEAFVIYRVKF